MNRIYKVIWSKVKNSYIVVGELVKNKRGGKSLRSKTNGKSLRSLRLEFARKVLVSILTASVFGMSSYVQAYNAGSNSKDYNNMGDEVDTIAIAIGSYAQAGINPIDNPKLNSNGKYVDKTGKVLLNQTDKPFISVSGEFCTEDNQFYTFSHSEDYKYQNQTYTKSYYISEDGLNKVVYDTNSRSYMYYPNKGLIKTLDSKQFYHVSNKDINGNYYAASDDYNKRVSLSQGATAIGNYNKALGDFSSVLGGNNNKAVGKGATVVGGSTPEFVGRAWITNDNGKYIDSSGQVLINQTSIKLTDISTNPYQTFRGVGGVFYDKNTKDIYRCGLTSDTYCYFFIDKNGNKYTGTKRGSLACDFIDQNGNRLNANNLLELSYVDCNGNYFDENGNPYLKDDFDKRVVSETEGALTIINNLAKGDFSTVIGGTGNLAQGEYSIVAGKNAVGIGTKSVAIGGNAQAILDNSIALGEGAVAQNIHVIESNAYAGLPSNTNNITVLSIGGGTGEDGKVVYRQIQGVAAGEISATSTDAINGSQLYAEVTKYTAKEYEITDKLNTEITERKEADTALGKRIDNIDSNINNLTKGVVKYDNDSNSKVTLAGAEGTVIANVKGGTISADSKEAINGSQLFAEQEARKASDITLQGNIDAEKTARENAVSNLANDVNTKVGVLTAKDAEIEGKVTAEKTTRESEVSRLDTRIDSINTSIGNIGNAVFYDSNEKATITLAGAEGTVIANVKGGTISADSKEAINGSQLFAEQEARKAFDITLQGNIDAEKTARENAVSNLAKDVNTKVGVLTAKDAEIEGKVNDLNTSFTSKVGELTAKDAEIEGKVNAEKTARENAVSNLAKDVNTKVGALTAKDAEIEDKVNDLNTSFTSKAGELTAKDSEIEGKINALDTSFTSKIGALTAKDAEIEGKVTAEKAARENAVSNLANDVNTKVGELTAKDSEIEGKVNALDTSFTSKIGVLTAKDAEIEGKVNELDTNFTSKIGALTAKDAEIEGKVTAEKTTRESEVSRLDTRIDRINTSIGNIGNAVFYDSNEKASITLAGVEGTVIANVKDGTISADSKEAINGSQLFAEQEARKASDLTLQGNIDAEKTARENAVNNLANDVNTKVGVLTAKDAEIEGKVNDLNTSFSSKVGELTAKDSEIEGKVNALDTNFTSKIGTLSAKDAEIEGKVTAEKAARENAVSNLANDVNTKVGELTAKDSEIEGKVNALDTRIDSINTSIGNAVFYDSNEKATITLAGAEGTVIANVKGGTISADSKEAINGSQLFAEQEARKASDITLQGNIDAEKTARENAVSNLESDVNTKVGALTAKDAEIEGKVNDLNTGFTTKVGELTAKDSEIEGKVNALDTRIDSINTSIGNIGNAVFYDSNEKASITLAGAEGTVIANVKGGTVSANSKEAINGSQLFAEQEARKASDITLQGNIDAEKTARENAVSNLANDVNTKVGVLTAKDAEIEGKVNDLNTSFTSKVGELTAKDIEIEGKVNDLNTGFTSKIGALNAKDTEIEGKVNAEKTTRESEVSRLDTRIDSINTSIGNIGNAVFYDSNEKAIITLAGAEGTVIANVKGGTVSANSKEAINGSQLFAEQEARKASDLTLQGNIDAEKTARENAVNSLANDVNTKVGELTAKDSEIEGKVNALDTSFTSKIGVLTAKDAEIEGKVNALDTSFTSKIGALTAKEAEIEGKVNAEKTTRESEVSRLDTRIDSINTSIGNIGNAVFYDSNDKASITLAGAEGTVIANVKGGTVSADSKEAINGSQLFAEQEARKTTDITLQGNIDAEKTARENAVSNLANDVNTKVGALTAKDAEIEGKVNAEKTARENAVSNLANDVNTKVGVLAAKDAEIEGKVNDLNTGFTTKVGELTAKDTEIEGKVNALDTRIDSINTSIGNIGNAVFYDSNEKASITLTGAEGTVIANVKGGTISADSKEAINGSQLFAEQEARKASDITLQGNIDAEKTARENAVNDLSNVLNAKNSALESALNREITDRTNSISNLRTEFTGMLNKTYDNFVAYDSTAKDRVSFGGSNGTVLSNLSDGVVASGSTDAVTGNQLFQEVQDRKHDISNLNSRIDNLIVSSSNGVNYDDSNKSSLTFKGTEGTTLKNVGAGSVTEGSMEAINGGQLYDEIQARKDADDALRKEFGNYVSEITENSIGYDQGSDKGKVTFKGENGTVLGNVGAGSVTEGSMEAVNGGQLFETNTKIDSLKNKIGSVKDGTFVKESNTVGDNINSLDKAVASNSTAIDDLGSRVSSGLSALGQSVNNVGAHAAALAALNPVADYDSKFSFAAGMGSYHSAKAGAIGLFYRPDDRYQFSIGGTTGNGEHLYNLGFSIALDKSVVGPFSNKKAMIREIVSLRDANKEQSKIIIEQTNEINELKKNNEEQDKKLAAQDAKIDKLMQLVESLASK